MSKKAGTVYYCEKIKADALGFHEKRWLDEQCKGWRVLRTAPVDPVHRPGLRYSNEGPVGGRRLMRAY